MIFIVEFMYLFHSGPSYFGSNVRFFTSFKFPNSVKINQNRLLIYQLVFSRIVQTNILKIHFAKSLSFRKTCLNVVFK